MESSNKWFADYCYKIHKKKLDLIKSKTSRRIDNAEPESLSMLKNRLKNVNAKKNMEYHNIYLKNQAILTRITEINLRSSSFQNLPLIKGPRSLNFTSRKLKNQNIAEQNSIFIKKLHEQIRSSLSVKKLNKEYERVEKIKKNISKKRLFFSLNTRSAKKLPPINEEYINQIDVNIKESKSTDESKDESEDLDYCPQPYKESQEDSGKIEENREEDAEIKVESFESRSRNSSINESDENIDEQGGKTLKSTQKVLNILN